MIDALLNWKIIVGLVLMCPMAFVTVWGIGLRFDDPALTETQLFIVTVPWLILSFIPGVAGAVLLMYGKQDYDND